MICLTAAAAQPVWVPTTDNKPPAGGGVVVGSESVSQQLVCAATAPGHGLNASVDLAVPGKWEAFFSGAGACDVATFSAGRASEINAPTFSLLQASPRITWGPRVPDAALAAAGAVAVTHPLGLSFLGQRVTVCRALHPTQQPPTWHAGRSFGTNCTFSWGGSWVTMLDYNSLWWLTGNSPVVPSSSPTATVSAPTPMPLPWPGCTCGANGNAVCSAGRWNMGCSPGSTLWCCTDCPPGLACTGPNAVTTCSCPPGFASASSATSCACYACPVGQFQANVTIPQPQAGISFATQFCLACPPNTTTLSPGQTACTSTVPSPAPQQSATCPAGTTSGPAALLAYTGSVQSYSPPAGATFLLVQLWGGGGGGSYNATPGGGGAYVAGVVRISALRGAALLVAVGGGGFFPVSGGPSNSNAVALGGARRGIMSPNNDWCAAAGAGPSVIALADASRCLVAVAGAGGGAGEFGFGGAAGFSGAGQTGGINPGNNFDRFTGGYNSGGGGGSSIAGGAIGAGYDANCQSWPSGKQTAGVGPLTFTSATAVSVTAGLSLCTCGGVGGGGFFGGGPGGWWCGGGGGSSFWNASMFAVNATGADGNGSQPGGASEPNYPAGAGVAGLGVVAGSGNGANGAVVITACFAPVPSVSPSVSPSASSSANMTCALTPSLSPTPLASSTSFSLATTVRAVRLFTSNFPTTCVGTSWVRASVAIVELRILDASGANLALAGAASADSAFDDNGACGCLPQSSARTLSVAALAIDGDLSTTWKGRGASGGCISCPCSTNPWLQIVLAEPSTVAAIVAIAGQTGSTPGMSDAISAFAGWTLALYSDSEAATPPLAALPVARNSVSAVTDLTATWTWVNSAAPFSPALTGCTLSVTPTSSVNSTRSATPSPLGLCPTCWANGAGTYPSCAGGSASTSNCTGWPWASAKSCPGTWFDRNNSPQTNFPCAGTVSSSSCNNNYRSYNTGCGPGGVYFCCVCPPGTGDTGSACTSCPGGLTTFINGIAVCVNSSSSSPSARASPTQNTTFVLTDWQTWAPVAVSRYGSQFCSLSVSGSVSCNPNPCGGAVPSATAGNPFVTILSAVGDGCHTFAQRADGTAAGWGYNGEGRISGISTTTSFRSLATGGHCTYAIQQDYTMVAAGYNAWGQCVAPSGSWAYVSGQYVSACGVTTSGATSCWGEGHGSPSSNAVLISRGDKVMCSITADGTTTCTGWYQLEAPGVALRLVAVGTDNPPGACGITAAWTIFCWGAAAAYTVPAGKFAFITSGDTTYCAVDAGGTVVCFGSASAALIAAAAAAGPVALPARIVNMMGETGSPTFSASPSRTSSASKLPTLSASPWPSLPSHEPSSAPLCARFVRITNTYYSGDMFNGILNFGDLKVFSLAGENVALGQPSSMSSVYDNGAGERYCGTRVDAAENGNDGNLCTFASTDRGTAQWWQVDLGRMRSDFASLSFYIRNDDRWSTFWAYRANGAIISLLDEIGNEIARTTLPSNVASLPVPFSFSVASFTPRARAASACAVISSPTPSVSAIKSARFTPLPSPSSSPSVPSTTYVVIIVVVIVGLPCSPALSAPGSDFSVSIRSAIAELLGMDVAAVEILSIGAVAGTRRLSSSATNDTSISFVLASPRASTAASLSSALSSGSAALASLTSRVAFAAGVSPNGLTAAVSSMSTVNVGGPTSPAVAPASTPSLSTSVLASAIFGGALVLIIAVAIAAARRSHFVKARAQAFSYEQETSTGTFAGSEAGRHRNDLAQRESSSRRPSHILYLESGGEVSGQSHSPKLLIRTPQAAFGSRRSSLHTDDA